MEASGSSNAEEEAPKQQQLPPQSQLEEKSPAWQSYISEEFPRTVVQSADAAIRSARSLHQNSSTHFRTLQDFVPQIVTHYRAFEDAFFNRVKDELIGASEHPFVVGGIAVSTGLLLMRGYLKKAREAIKFWSILPGMAIKGQEMASQAIDLAFRKQNSTFGRFYAPKKTSFKLIRIVDQVEKGLEIVPLKGPRRFLFRHTFGRLQSEEAQFVRAEKNVKELNLSVDLMKKESRKLLERAALAEKDMTHGRSQLMNAGTEMQRLAKSAYKTEVQATDLMDGLREIPGRESLRLRAEVASMAALVRQLRIAMNKRMMKTSELGIPI